MRHPVPRGGPAGPGRGDGRPPSATAILVAAILLRHCSPLLYPGLCDSGSHGQLRGDHDDKVPLRYYLCMRRKGKVSLRAHSELRCGGRRTCFSHCKRATEPSGHKAEPADFADVYMHMALKMFANVGRLFANAQIFGNVCFGNVMWQVASRLRVEMRLTPCEMGVLCKLVLKPQCRYISYRTAESTSDHPQGALTPQTPNRDEELDESEHTDVNVEIEGYSGGMSAPAQQQRVAACSCSSYDVHIDAAHAQSCIL